MDRERIARRAYLELATGRGGIAPGRPAYRRFGSNSAVAAALTLPPLWVRERYGPKGTKRQIFPLAAVVIGLPL